MKNTIHKTPGYVPLDYIKGQIIDHYSSGIIYKLMDHLNFGEDINPDTGEVIEKYGKNGWKKAPYRRASFKNLDFIYYYESKRLCFSGSLHVFYNAINGDGEHNNNDFGIDQFYSVLSTFESLWGIKPYNIHISQLEWGYNIKHPYSSDSIIQGCIMHKNVPFKDTFTKTDGTYYVSSKCHYQIKIYNKALQHKINSKQILRIERKQTNYSIYCRKYGIGQSLQDLIDSNFIGLMDNLIENWNEIVFFDHTITSTNNRITKYNNPVFWVNYSKTRKTKANEIKRMRSNNRKYGRNVQSKILELMIKKQKELAVVTKINLIYS